MATPGPRRRLQLVAAERVPLRRLEPAPALVPRVRPAAPVRLPLAAARVEVEVQQLEAADLRLQLEAAAARVWPPSRLQRSTRPNVAA